MNSLLNEINIQSESTVLIFKSIEIELDYSVNSLIEIDRFVQKHTKNGKAIRGGYFSNDYVEVTFSIGTYIGQTLIKNIPDSKWMLDDAKRSNKASISIELADKTNTWPVQQLRKRIENGLADGIYPYAFELTKNSSTNEFDNSFWEIEKNVKPMKPRLVSWKFK